jgi:hypothetical protein
MHVYFHYIIPISFMYVCSPIYHLSSMSDIGMIDTGMIWYLLVMSIQSIIM